MQSHIIRDSPVKTWMEGFYFLKSERGSFYDPVTFRRTHLWKPSVIYERAQVNGQLQLRCSARQMEREYSEDFREDGNHPLCSSDACLGRSRWYLAACLMGAGARRPFAPPVFWGTTTWCPSESLSCVNVYLLSGAHGDAGESKVNRPEGF